MPETKNFEFVVGMFVDPVFPSDVPEMSMEERAEFVRGLLDNSVFSSMHIHEADKKRGDLGKVFLPQERGIFQQAPKSFLDNIGVLWEFTKDQRVQMHKGSKTGVSYPTFGTCRVCSKLDWDLACDAIKCLKAETGVVGIA